MIPHTFPTTVDGTTRLSEMVVYELASIVGLTRWVDYIPVKTVATSSTAQGTTNSGGYQPVNVLGSTAGLTAWINYIPVYQDAAATEAWTCSSSGYIPVAVSV